MVAVGVVVMSAAPPDNERDYLDLETTVGEGTA